MGHWFLHVGCNTYAVSEYVWKISLIIYSNEYTLSGIFFSGSYQKSFHLCVCVWKWDMSNVHSLKKKTTYLGDPENTAIFRHFSIIGADTILIAF